jgi:predicted TIM-barrel fold metal-dependent hydrolase
MAEKLDVAIYLQPTSPTEDVSRLLYQGTYDGATASRLGRAAFGWHVDTGTHILRLYAAGLFARFPKWKIIIGHSAEDLPMFLDRVDSIGLRTDDTFNRVSNSNIWVTTSAFFTSRVLQMLRQVTRMDRIMYSVDYPFANYTQGWAFIRELAESGALTKEEMDAFAYGNAEGLLKLTG